MKRRTGARPTTSPPPSGARDRTGPTAAEAEAERTRLTAEVERQRDLLQAVIEQFPGGIAVGNDAAIVTLASKQGEMLTGYPSMVGVQLDERAPGRIPLYSDETRQVRIDDTLSSRALHGESSQRDVFAERNDGTLVPLRCMAAPLRDRHGGIIGSIAAFYDISAEKAREQERERLLESERAARAKAQHAEEALREILQRLADSEARLRFALASAQAGCWDWDVRADQLVWSEETYRVSGMAGGGPTISFDDWLGHVHPEDRAEAAERIRRCFAERSEDYRAEYRILHPTLGVRWVRALGRTTYDAEGAPVRMAGISGDITAQKRTEHERELLLDETRRAVRSRDEVLAVVSHDLRNHLGVVVFAAAQLARRAGSDGLAVVRPLVDHVRRATGGMERIISDLLDVASIENGRLVIEPADADAAEVVREGLALFGVLADHQGVALRAALDALEGVTISCDRARVVQVLSNLLGNALKFVPRGLGVEVGGYPAGREAVIFVRDEGPGIPAESLPHVFDRYWQAERAHGAHRKNGIGLGLAIVKGIVEGHGGRLWAESPPGRGATFAFSLPLVARPAST
jgi:PAS domain S-box-containing protein